MDIFVVDISGVEFSSLERYLDCVSAGRRKVVLDKKQEESRIQSLVGGLLLRSEISKRTGAPMKKIVFDKGAHGKPYIKGGGIQFSLSHTKGAVCAAFADDEGEIGVDIERRDRRASEALKRKTLSENEKALVTSDAAFVRIWVKKEAFLKRTGIGIATKLNGADTTLIPDVAAFECGEYFVGASGKGVEQANIVMLPLSELLARFDV
ncbi:MAG: 4'-phosphopantetheinyl transferase superfamily protein [Ruminococcaceae bacterium]|nr:4'-phosphopantetheinyl transferase superfamily protein [Oscillospiraceae bacterium]